MRPSALAVSVPLLLSVCIAAGAQAPTSDWSAVGEALGKPGKVLTDGTYRVDVPRTDPTLRNEFGFVVPPSMVLTYAAFALCCLIPGIGQRLLAGTKVSEVG